MLVGAPSGSTRVISIAAYEAAFEQYDYSMASAVAMIMGFVQLIVVVIVLARAARLLSPARSTGGKGMNRIALVLSRLERAPARP